MATTIDTISTLTDPPNPQTDSEAVFSTKATAYVASTIDFGATANVAIGQMNTANAETETNAALAQTAAEASETSADYKGLWAGKTNAGTVGQSYSHLDYIWRLNVNIADLSTSEPSEANADWSYANGPLRSDLEIKKPVGSFDQSSMSALSIDGSSGVKLRHSGEDLGTYTGFSFSVAGQETSPQGVAIDSFGNFWVVGYSTDTVFKYDSTGVYTGFSFSVSTEETNPRDIAIDSLGNFWVVGTVSDSVFKYDSTGVYTGFSFSVATEETTPIGVAIDSLGNFWVVGLNTDSVFKYDSTGVYTGFSFSVAGQETTPTGVAIDSFGNFWVVGLNTDKVYKYNSDGTYANFSFSVAGQETSPQGVAIDSFGNFWVTGLNTSTVFKYTAAPSSTLVSRFNDVDLGVMQIDSETNQAAMVKPLKVREPINDDEAASKNTVDVGDAALQTQITAINARQLLDFGKYAKFVDKKTNGTDGGATTVGTNVTRTLNTTVSDNITGLSRSGNEITAGIGKYYMKISCPAFAVDRHVAWLRNVSTTNVIPDSEFTSSQSNNSTGSQTRTEFSGEIEFLAQTTFDIRHYAETTSAVGLGLATNAGIDEVYTTLEIWKLD